MIYDKLNHSGIYFESPGWMSRAIAFAKSFDGALPDGKYEIDKDDAYAVVGSYKTQPAQSLVFEAHRRYADVHIVLEGAERFDFVPMTDELIIDMPYDQADDGLTYQPIQPYSSVLLLPGMFCVCYPHDVHRPGVNLTEQIAVRKMVLKVTVKSLSC